MNDLVMSKAAARAIYESFDCTEELRLLAKEAGEHISNAASSGNTYVRYNTSLNVSNKSVTSLYNLLKEADYYVNIEFNEHLNVNTFGILIGQEIYISW